MGRHGPAARAAWDRGRFRERGGGGEPGKGMGVGLFETIRLLAGVPLYTRDHLERLVRSARTLGLPLPAAGALAAVERAAAGLAHQARLREGRCRVTWEPGRLSVQVAALEPMARGRAVPACSAPWRRGGESPAHRHKTLSRIENRLALAAAEKQGAFESLFFDQEDALLEGTRTNVFVVQGGVVVTPAIDAPILPGIARSRVLGLLETSGMAFRESRLHRGELLRAEEIFLTNALRGVVPVASVDGRRVGAGRPGEITRLVQDRLERSAIEEAMRLTSRSLRASRGSS
jgi:branched-chain amino acid aminotransferase